MRHGIFRRDSLRKITIEVPADLLDQAQQASGTGITQTVRTGLQLVAVSQACARLRGMRSRVRFSRTSAELKYDRLSLPGRLTWRRPYTTYSDRDGPAYPTPYVPKCC